jgi:uncharacterized repeat protein (TIGR01451 family)
LSGPATQLVLVAPPPANISVGHSFSLTVAAEDGSGDVVPDDDSPVTIAIASGPSGASLGGDVTALNNAGVATFPDLTLDTSGTYTLRVISGVDAISKNLSVTVGTIPTPTPSPTPTATRSDLALTITSNPNSMQVDQNVVYTLKVVNNGPDDATGVTLSDVLPANLTDITASASQGSAVVNANGTVTANLGALASGSSVTVTIVAEVTAGALPTGASSATLTNTATVSSQALDPNPANNIMSTSTEVLPVADLALTTPTSAPTPTQVATPTPTPTTSPTPAPTSGTSSNTSGNTSTPANTSGQSIPANANGSSTSGSPAPSNETSGHTTAANVTSSNPSDNTGTANEAPTANGFAAANPGSGDSSSTAANPAPVASGPAVNSSAIGIGGGSNDIASASPEASGSASSSPESDGSTNQAGGGSPGANETSANSPVARNTTINALRESLGLNQTSTAGWGSDNTATEGPAQLLALTETSLPLVGTLLNVMLDDEPSVTLSNGSARTVELNVTLLPGAIPSLGAGATSGAAATSTGASAAAARASSSVVTQGLLDPYHQADVSLMVEAGEAVKGESIANPILRGPSTWSHFLPSIDEAIDQLRKDHQAPARGDQPDAADETAQESGVDPLSRLASPAQAVDDAIHAVWAENASHAPPLRRALHGPVAVSMSLVLSGIAITRVSPLVDALRDRWRSDTRTR